MPGGSSRSANSQGHVGDFDLTLCMHRYRYVSIGCSRRDKILNWIRGHEFYYLWSLALLRRYFG